MAATLDAAVREVLREDLKGLTEQHCRQEQRTAAVELQLTELRGRLDEKDRAIELMHKEVSRQGAELEALRVKGATDLAALASSLAKRLDRQESCDDDGFAGLAQLRRRVGSLAQELETLRQRAKTAQEALEEHGRMAAVARRGAEDQAVALAKRCTALEGERSGTEERLRAAEAEGASLIERQQILENAVAKKHESLWEDAHRIVLEANRATAEALRADLEQRKEDARQEGRSQVRTVTQLVATVHDERRKLVLSKDLMTLWREQTWTSTQRRTGHRWLASALNRMAQSRMRTVLTRWVRSTAIEDLSLRLQREFSAKVPDVLQILNKTGLRAQCDKLHSDLEALRSDRCTNKALEEAIDKAKLFFEDKLRVLGDVKSQVSDHSEAIKQAHAKVDGQGLSTEGLGTRLEEHQKLQERRHEELMTLASGSGQEVKNVMRDVLMIWNSIKNLDAAKADRKDVDAFAAEQVGRTRHGSHSLEELQSEIDTRVREEGLQLSKRCAEMDEKISDSAKQAKRWEEMWEKLAAHVEELVVKVGELQGGLGSARGPPGAGLRSDSRGRPRSRAPEIPAIPGSLPAVAMEGLAGAGATPSVRGLTRSESSRSAASVDERGAKAKGAACWAAAVATPPLSGQDGGDAKKSGAAVEQPKHVTPAARPKAARPRSASASRRAHDML